MSSHIGFIIDLRGAGKLHIYAQDEQKFIAELYRTSLFQTLPRDECAMQTVAGELVLTRVPHAGLQNPSGKCR